MVINTQTVSCKECDETDIDQLMDCTECGDSICYACEIDSMCQDCNEAEAVV